MTNAIGTIRVITRTARDISPKVVAGQWGAVAGSVVGAAITIAAMQIPVVGAWIPPDMGPEIGTALVGIVSAAVAAIGARWAAYRAEDRLTDPGSQVRELR